VTFKLRQPYGPLLNLLATIPILPRHKLANVAAGSFNSAWSLSASPADFAGLGPFKLKEVQQTGIPFFRRVAKVILERNDFYWKVDENGTRLPYLDQVVILIAQDEGEALATFQAGTADLALDLNPQDVPALESTASQAGFQVLKDGLMFTILITFNQDVANPALQAIFRDRRFREAIARAIDDSAVLRSFPDGLGVLSATIFNPFAPYGKLFAQTAVQYEFDLDKSNVLLDAMGLKDTDGDGIREMAKGEDLAFELITREDDEARVKIAQLFVHYFAQIGIKVNLKLIAPTEVDTRTSKPASYETAIFGLLDSRLDPTVFLYSVFSSQGDLHFYRYSDAQGKDLPEAQQRLDQLIQQQLLESGSEKRGELLTEIQGIISEDLPLIPFAGPQFVYAVRNDIRNADKLWYNAFPLFAAVIWRQ